MSRYLRPLAELLVRFGANVQPGQIVSLGCQPGQEELARAVAQAAYARGALFVDQSVFDPHLKRIRALHADPDTLGFIPPWYGARVLALGEHRGARIALTGPVEPDLMRDVDPARLGRDTLPSVPEGALVMNARTTNWAAGPCPNPGWAHLVHPELDPERALERLWEEIAHVCRLDEPDPVAAWETRLSRLKSVAQTLSSLRLDRLRFEGPGTDLEIGLLRSSVWHAADLETVDGIRHVPNLPTEEVFTTPDPERTRGIVTATKPLFAGGTVIRGLRVQFESGRVTSVEADEGAGTFRALTEQDDGSRRLGEVALVDREGRIGPLGTIFYDTLLDENAASHIAIGAGLEFLVEGEDLERVSSSRIHVDFMIGGDEVSVTGVTGDGTEVALLRSGSWQL